ncbi:O-antigen ligase family protein [Galbibacter sp. PAP.153]|uniref:O-antigen ligase family protein n=1 Tax=Galbibacter sp. PAP.153 TaxID=3104623 RepID=UPI0030083408
MINTIQHIKTLFYQDENSNLVQRVFWNSLYIAFFLLPIDINYPTPFFAVAIVSGGINIFKGDKQYLSENKILLLFPLYFLMLLLSMFYTENVSDGWYLIQRSLTLLLFPVIFLFVKEDGLSVRKLFDFLLYGLIVSFFINLLMVLYDVFLFLGNIPPNSSFFDYVKQGWDFFMHVQFSSLVNPGYISLYILLVLSYYLKKELNTIFRLLTVIVLFVYLFLLATESAYFTLFIMALLLLLKVKDKVRRNLLILVLVLGTLVFLSNPRIIDLNSNLNARGLKEVSVNNPTISESLRLLSWRASIKAINEAPLLGYGVGDAHEELVQKYKQLGYNESYEHRYNAHNQFLETWLQMGVVGVFALMLIFTFLAYSMRRSYNEFSVFLALFIALLFESMLVRFNGIVFFSIIVPLLLKKRSILSSRIIRNE